MHTQFDSDTLVRTNGYSKALFGGLLWGDRPVRYVFVDEAGTSTNEPVTVVVGLIAHADDHVMTAEALVAEAIGAVPTKLQDSFVFHAMQVYGEKKYQDAGWGLTDRLELLQTMMGIPRKVGIAICVAAHWRGSTDLSASLGQMGLTPTQSDHFSAFSLCMAVADRNIRKYAGPREVATVVAEDVPEMRQFLKMVPKLLRAAPYNMPQAGMRQTVSDAESGFFTQKGDLRVTRIRKSVHFVEKDEDPLVQIADACAYGFRRFFAQEKFGAEFAKAILGDDHTTLRNFGAPGGCQCYWGPNVN